MTVNRPTLGVAAAAAAADAATSGRHPPVAWRHAIQRCRVNSIAGATRCGRDDSNSSLVRREFVRRRLVCVCVCVSSVPDVRAHARIYAESVSVTGGNYSQSRREHGCRSHCRISDIDVWPKETRPCQRHSLIIRRRRHVRPAGRPSVSDLCSH